MSSRKQSVQWKYIGHSERGASHIRQDLPNQDAIKAELSLCKDPSVVLAIADGHGSPKSFRSDIGAQIAVDVSVATLRDFLIGVKDCSSPSTIKSLAEQKIPLTIYKAWRAEVQRHIEQNPFQDEEWARLERVAGPAAKGAVTTVGKEYVIYGATALAAVVTDSFMVFVQIGDGEILTVPIRGEAACRAMPTDERLLANETTSLCEDEAWKNFRVRFQNLTDTVPALILLTTDGYPNSFESPAGFLKCGSDLLEILSTDGPDAVDRNLPIWLSEASRLGSGDDVTVGLLYPVSSITPALKVEKVSVADQALTATECNNQPDAKQINPGASGKVHSPPVRPNWWNIVGIALSGLALVVSALLSREVVSMRSELKSLGASLAPGDKLVNTLPEASVADPLRAVQVQPKTNPPAPSTAASPEASTPAPPIQAGTVTNPTATPVNRGP